MARWRWTICKREVSWRSLQLEFIIDEGGLEEKKKTTQKPSFHFGKLQAINAIPSPLTPHTVFQLSGFQSKCPSQQPAVSSGGRLAEGELGGCYAG